jgi:hypothetical protein
MPVFRTLLVMLAGLVLSPADELSGRVMCGYQGWFRCEGEGSGRGWHHYAVDGRFEPGHSHIEMWPDMREYGADERHATSFRHADGTVAEVFSSTHPATVRRHFRWMREYGIDGVFLQRFATQTLNPTARAGQDRVLANCRAAAAAENRKWVLMYDLSGMKTANFPKLIDDWKRLHTDGPMKGPDPAYLPFRGKPLVALWGIGFNDRPANLIEWEKLIRFFRDAGHSVMLGVPCYWRTLERDSIRDPKLHELIAMADIVSPWAVGRFGTPEQAAKRADSWLKPDLEWCTKRGIRYLPVAFPGFSWHNLQKSRGRDEQPDAIPRLGGRFLWSQAEAVRNAGLDSIYIAMFDEMDEGTAIFKTTQDPPAGASPFLAEPGLESDHYLRVTGSIGRLLRGEKPTWKP